MARLTRKAQSGIKDFLLTTAVFTILNFLYDYKKYAKHFTTRLFMSLADGALLAFLVVLVPNIILAGIVKRKMILVFCNITSDEIIECKNLLAHKRWKHLREEDRNRIIEIINRATYPNRIMTGRIRRKLVLALRRITQQEADSYKKILGDKPWKKLTIEEKDAINNIIDRTGYLFGSV